MRFNMAGKFKTTQPKDATINTDPELVSIPETSGDDPAIIAIRNRTRRRMLLVKATLVLLMALSVGSLTGFLLQRLDTNSIEREFRTIAEEKILIATNVIEKLELAAISMARLASSEFPDAGDWPNNVWIEDFGVITHSLLRSIRENYEDPNPELALFLVPLVAPSEISDFVAHIGQHQHRESLPSEGRLYETGWGDEPRIWEMTPYDDDAWLGYSRPYEVSNKTEDYKFLAPISQYSGGGLSEYALMNLHGAENRTTGTIDRLSRCLRYFAATPNTTYINKFATIRNGEDACRRYAFGSFVPNPWKKNLFDGSSAVMVPVYPEPGLGDNDSTVPVGFVVGAVSWQKIAEEMNYDSDDLEVVFRRDSLRSDTETGRSTNKQEAATYRLEEGGWRSKGDDSLVHRIGYGDQHDTSMDQSVNAPLFEGGRSVDFGPGDTDWETHSLSVYPSKRFFEKHQTSSALCYGLFSSVGILVVASLLIFIVEKRKKHKE